MPDTIRTDAEILALLADNTAGAISAQDMRDAYVSLLDRDAAKVDTGEVDHEILEMWRGTQAEYDALGTYSATTFYVITA